MKVCRSCGHSHLTPLLSLERIALANALLSSADLEQPEELFPLDLAFCDQCALVRIMETVAPERLFREYLYFSAYSDRLLNHVKGLSADMVRQRRLGPDSVVIEVASNDGYLLQFYREANIPVLGIEPAVNVARVAQKERGIPTITEFFGQELAHKLVQDGKSADVIHAHNVLAHVADLNGFVAGISLLLKDSGVAVIEAPYLLDMIDKLEFDTIYHEHLCYFSLTALGSLFARHGMGIHDVYRMPIHGGSLRLFVSKRGANPPTPRVTEMMSEESQLGVQELAFYRGFAHRVETLKVKLKWTLSELKAAGNRLAAYGASAKATVLLNYCGLGTDVFDYVVDRSPHKIGRFVPGVRLPIYPPEKLLETVPEYTLLTVWNIADEVMEQQAEYLSKGGRFIRPIPEVAIL